MPIDQETIGEARQAKIISLLSPKGGTGKTTISMVIARHLASKGLRVIVLDFDLVTAGVTLSLGGNNRSSLAPENCIFDILRLDSPEKEIELGQIVPLEVPLPRGKVGVIHLIASVRSAIPSRADRIEETRFSDLFREISPKQLEQRVTMLLQTLKPQFDYIIIDTRGGLDELNVIPPMLSDLGLLISDQSRVAYYQILHSRTQIEKWALALGRNISLNETPAYHGIILNKSSGEPEEVKKEFARQLALAAGQPLLGVVPFVREVLQSGEEGEIPPPNLEFDYWLHKSLKDGLTRARIETHSFDTLGKGLWLQERARRGASELPVYVALLAVVFVAISAAYRPEEVRAKLGVYLTGITAALLVTCTAVLGVLVYKSRTPRFVFSTAIVNWGRWALVVVTLASCTMAGVVLRQVQERIVGTQAELAQKVDALTPFHDAIARTGFLARAEMVVPGCVVRTISVVAPLLPDASKNPQPDLEVVILPAANGVPTFDDQPKIQSDGSVVTATAKIHGLGQWRGSFCPAGPVAATVELRRKRLK